MIVFVTIFLVVVGLVAGELVKIKELRANTELFVESVLANPAYKYPMSDRYVVVPVWNSSANKFIRGYIPTG